MLSVFIAKKAHSVVKDESGLFVRRLPNLRDVHVQLEADR